MSVKKSGYWVVGDDGIPLSREEVIENYKTFEKRYSNPKEGYKNWRNTGFENYKNTLKDATPTDFTKSTLTRGPNNTWVGDNERTDYTTFEEPTQFKNKRSFVKYAFYEKNGKWYPSYIGDIEYRDDDNFDWESYYDTNNLADKGIDRNEKKAFKHWLDEGQYENSDRITTRPIRESEIPQHGWGNQRGNQNIYDKRDINMYDKLHNPYNDGEGSLAHGSNRKYVETGDKAHGEIKSYEIIGEIELDLSNDVTKGKTGHDLSKEIYKELINKIEKLGNTGNGSVATSISDKLTEDNIPVTFNSSINNTLEKALPRGSSRYANWTTGSDDEIEKNSFGKTITHWGNPDNGSIGVTVNAPVRNNFISNKGDDYILEIENEFRQKEADIVKPINEKSSKANKINQVKNDVYQSIKDIASRTNSNEYLLRRDGSAQTGGGWNTESNKDALINAGMTEDEADAFMDDAIEKSWDPFYRNEKLNTWDPLTAGAKLPDYVEGAPNNPSFDPIKYRMEIIENEGYPPQDLDGNFIESSHPLSQWHIAEQKGDLDIIEKYGTTKDSNNRYLPNGYFHWHYTTVGKDKGYRGSQAKDTTEAINYRETISDAELGLIRDKQLGVTIGDETSASLSERMLGINKNGEAILDDNNNQIGSQTLRDAWDNARNQEHADYDKWQTLAKENFLNINNPDDFVNLWRLAKADDEIDMYLPDIEGIPGVTTLEEAISHTLGAQGAIEMTKFGGLSADILKATTRQLQKQKAREEEMAMFSNIDGFSEIYNFNELFKNELMADSGVGGILALTGDKDKFEENLEGTISKLTGINNNVEYNWQKWFDSEFEKRYRLNPILDSDGNPLEERVQDVDQDGNLLYEQLPVTDEEGNPTYDDDNNPITVDDPTRPIYRKDKDGNYIKRLVFDDPTTDEDESRIYIDARDYDIYGNRKKDEEGNPLMTRMELDKGYIDEYIRNYLTPRFNHSKSMNEFVDLINVRDADMNPFQTENKYSTVTQVAKEQGEKFLNSLKGITKTFDAAYYLDPTTKINRDIGIKQRDLISQDRINAVNDPNQLVDGSDPYSLTWAQAKYRYGITNDDISDNEKWAKFHYDAKGEKWKDRISPTIDGIQYQGILFDPALDVSNPTDIDVHIDDVIQPILSQQYQIALKHGEFGRFISPEDFADMMLKEAEFMTPEEWKKLKAALDLEEDDDSTIDELRDMIEETIRGYEGHKIRAQIEYLNEKNKKPTQKLLGIDYIQRDEDHKPKSGTTKTELYSIFKNAGFQGDEDTFYNEFMSDVSREEQEFLTKALRGNLNLKKISDDPLTAFTMFDGFFDREDTEEDVIKDIEERERLFGDEVNYEANESTFFDDYFKKKSEFSDIANFFN